MTTPTSNLILLAEDDQNDVFLITRALRNAQVVNPLAVVGDGEQAIAYLAGEGKYNDRDRFPVPSLLLLDLKMPRKTGLDVLHWLRNQPGLGCLPVVVLTSSREKKDIEHAYELGANSYLVKPVAFGELIEMVRTVGFYWMILNEPPALGGPGAG